MLNVYSCGCSAVDVPVMSRCVEHNGYVVASIDNKVEKPEIRRSDDKSLTIIHDKLLPSMRRIKEGKVGLIFTYPDHCLFALRDTIDDKLFTTFPDKFFPECDRVLNDDGHIVLIVEGFVLHSVLYCAIKSGFKVNSISVCRLLLQDEPLQSKLIQEYYSYKTCVVLSRSGKGKTIPNLKLGMVNKIINHFDPKGIVLDTSCIHRPLIFESCKTRKTIGIVPNKRRFNSVVDGLRKI
jgi:hypothetical protein